MGGLGKWLIILGLAVLVLGLIVTFIPSLRLGRLPGDIIVKRENWRVYIPITTSILLSVLLTLIVWLISVFRR